MTITLFHLANEMLSMIARRSIVGQHHAGLVVIFSTWPADIEVISGHRSIPGKKPVLGPRRASHFVPAGLFNSIISRQIVSLFSEHSPLLSELSKRPPYLLINGAKRFLRALGGTPTTFLSPLNHPHC